MSDVAAASHLLRDVVRVNAGATVSERIAKAARKLGWPYNRTRDVWYEQARRIDAAEMDRLREVRLEEARKAHAELTTLILDMEADASRIRSLRHSEPADRVRGEGGKATAGLGRVGRSGTGDIQ